MNVTSVTLRALQVLQGVTLRYITQKSEFLNNFVSLTLKRINSIIVRRVCVSACLKERKESNKEKKEIKSFFLSCLQEWGKSAWQVVFFDDVFKGWMFTRMCFNRKWMLEFITFLGVPSSKRFDNFIESMRIEAV